MKNEIKMLISSSGKNATQLAAQLKISRQSFANSLSEGGPKNVSKLLDLVDACGASLQVVTKGGTVIRLDRD